MCGAISIHKVVLIISALYTITGGLRNKGVKFVKIDLSEFTRFFESDWWRAVVLVTERLSTNQIEKSVQNRRDRFLR